MECLLCAPHTACAVTFHPHSSPVTQNYNHHSVTHEETGPGQVRHFCEVTRLGNAEPGFKLQDGLTLKWVLFSLHPLPPRMRGLFDVSAKAHPLTPDPKSSLVCPGSCCRKRGHVRSTGPHSSETGSLLPPLPPLGRQSGLGRRVLAEK